MSVLDKLVAAVTPEPDEDKRMQVRSDLRSGAPAGTWLTMVLDHHERIEQAFAAIKNAADAGQQRAAQKQLAVVLTGHSVAEEVVLYPAMALSDQKGHSTAAYTEQSAAKVQIAALEYLEPLSEDYFDKLEHLRAAVSHHMYEEESTWFPQLRDTAESAQQTLLTQRFQEEYSRYVDGGSQAALHGVDAPMAESIGSADGSGAIGGSIGGSPVAMGGGATVAKGPPGLSTQGGSLGATGSVASDREAVDEVSGTGSTSSVL